MVGGWLNANGSVKGNKYKLWMSFVNTHVENMCMLTMKNKKALQKEAIKRLGEVRKVALRKWEKL